MRHITFAIYGGETDRKKHEIHSLCRELQKPFKCFFPQFGKVIAREYLKFLKSKSIKCFKYSDFCEIQSNFGGNYEFLCGYLGDNVQKPR